jgi:hypothetical protein
MQLPELFDAEDRFIDRAGPHALPDQLNRAAHRHCDDDLSAPINSRSFMRHPPKSPSTVMQASSASGSRPCASDLPNGLRKQRAVDSDVLFEFFRSHDFKVSVRTYRNSKALSRSIAHLRCQELPQNLGSTRHAPGDRGNLNTTASHAILRHSDGTNRWVGSDYGATNLQTCEVALNAGKNSVERNLATIVECSCL